MTQPTTLRLPAGGQLSAATSVARRRISIAGLSISGMLLFATSLLVVASGFLSMRPEVMGLRLHPYLVPVSLAFPFVVMSRIHLFPPKVLAAMLVFFAMYIFSVFNGGSIALGEIFKVASAFITIITCALLVQRRGDFVAGALGLSIAVALLAVRGLVDDSHGATDVMEGANKNSYSMFSLPAILLAGYTIISIPTTPVIVKAILIGCTLPALAVTFMGANRSGWLGAVLIGLMLFWNQRGKGLILVAVLGAAVAFWILRFGSTGVLKERWRQTVEGNKSDESRVTLLLTCIQLGLENPIIGVSPQRLGWELGRKTSLSSGLSVYDSHNVFGHIIGGSGLICFGALLAVAWTMCTLKPRDGTPLGGRDDPAREARKLARMLVVLWAARGMFTREILYNPSFSIAIGLVIGLFMLAEVARQGQPVPGLKPSA